MNTGFPVGHVVRLVGCSSVGVCRDYEVPRRPGLIRRWYLGRRGATDRKVMGASCRERYSSVKVVEMPLVNATEPA